MERKIYFAGGCFWGVEHFFKGVDGVVKATPGYANGNLDHQPSYEEVYTDKTGFAETVEVRYDPARVSLPELVDLYFTVIDPLSLNRQGGDVGTRYRTGVYYVSDEDMPPVADRFEKEASRLGAPLAVELEPLRHFYPAEEYHQEYLDKNPGGYCHIPLPAFRYLRLYQDLKALLGDEPDPVARMAEASALIQERMRWHWVGFYRVAPKGGVAGGAGTGTVPEDCELVLGPFAGPVACLRIGYGKGVCGTAWKENRTVIVPDVDRFPGHIACSSLSRSEIVVPVYASRPADPSPRHSRPDRESSPVAVLDVDSAEPDTFGPLDALWLEKIAGIIG
jgi:peptide methionine sulfoxide reductase msrA/msrB